MDIPASPPKAGGFVMGFVYGLLVSVLCLAVASAVAPLRPGTAPGETPQLLPADPPTPAPVPSSTDNAVLPSATVPELQQIARATGRDPSAPRAPNADLSPSGPRLTPGGSLSPVADGGPVRLGRASGGGSTVLRVDQDLPRRGQSSPTQGPLGFDPAALGQGVDLDTTSAAVPNVDDGTSRPRAVERAPAPAPGEATAQAVVQSRPQATTPVETPAPADLTQAEQIAQGPAPEVETAQGDQTRPEADTGEDVALAALPPAPEVGQRSQPQPSLGPVVPQSAPITPRANAQSAPTPRAPASVPSLPFGESSQTIETEVTLGAGIRASQPKDKKALAAEVQQRVDAAQKRQKTKEAAGQTRQVTSLAPDGAGLVVGPGQTTYLNTLPVQTLNYATAFRSNRMPFEAPANRPLLSIVLVDIGSEGVARDALRAVQFPVSFAIEANMVGAADVAREYRALGFETLAMMPSVGDLVFQKGDDPQRLDRNIGALLGAVPTAVAMVDRLDGPLPLDANLTRTTLRALQVTGHGLLTHRSRGLNQVDRQARSVGVPSAAIARVVDARPGEQSVRVALDRAVLDAAKLGASVVIGRTDADTMTAVMSWVLGPGGKSVQLAPVSAVISRLSQ